MSYNILALSLVGKFFSAVFFGLSLLLYKAPPDTPTVADASLTASHNTHSMQTVVSTVSENAVEVDNKDNQNHIT